MLRTGRLVVLGALAATLGLAAPQAQAVITTCPVNASGGFTSCLILSNPSGETVKANAGSGTPYRFQLVRSSDGARWGYWQYADLNYHLFGLSLSGTITAQVDNLGTGNPSTYWVEMI